MKQKMLLWIICLALSGLHAAAATRYVQCIRGRCTKVADREAEFEFDQPVPQFYSDLTAKYNLTSYNAFVRFDAKGKQETDLTVPNIIHMIWLGSSIPQEYHIGPRSIAALNPDYEVIIWVEKGNVKEKDFSDLPNIKIKDPDSEVWSKKSLMKKSTNYAMISDILRLEIIYRYGGIYLDIDSIGKRPFGPVFEKAFLSYTPPDWKQSEWENNIQGVTKMSAMISNEQFAMPKGSAFLQYVLDCLSENFHLHETTFRKTGPEFLTAVFLQYPYSEDIQLIDFRYTVMETSDSVVVDHPSDADWSDKENILTGEKYCRDKNNPGNCQDVRRFDGHNKQ